MSNKIMYDERILDLDKLYSLILDRKHRYLEDYHRQPIYIKIPTWVYIILRQQCGNIVGYSFDNDIETLFGFRVIETPTIESIYEIELL